MFVVYCVGFVVGYVFVVVFDGGGVGLFDWVGIFDRWYWFCVGWGGWDFELGVGVGGVVDGGVDVFDVVVCVFGVVYCGVLML